MVSRFMSLLIVSLTLMGFSTGCVTALQDRNDYPDIQAGKQTVLLIKVNEKAAGKLVFAMGGFESGGELSLCGDVSSPIGYSADTLGGLIGCKYSVGFLSKELSKEGWFYLILKPSVYYLAFLKRCYAGQQDSLAKAYRWGQEALRTAQRWTIDLPKGSRVIYGGSVHVNCSEYYEVLLNNDETLAAKIVSEHMPELGALKTLLLQPHRGGPMILKRP